MLISAPLHGRGWVLVTFLTARGHDVAITITSRYGPPWSPLGQPYRARSVVITLS
jgi:hypothetical protein